MSVQFSCGESPIWEYPAHIAMHPAGGCDGTCRICIEQQRAREDGTARIVGTCVWSGTETHSILRRSLLDRLLGRPGKWVPDAQ
jgi:hypothetical protein